MAGNPTLPTENINEVILRLLALEPNEIDEIDYQTYSQYLKELLVQITSSARKIDGSELDKIKNEFKRVRGKKGRFKIKKAKITATGLGLGGIRKQVKVAQSRLMLAPVGGVPKQTSELDLKKKDTDSNILVSISNILDSILSTLTNINSQNKARIEKERRGVESGKRGLREKELESKSFEGIKKIVSAITKPFQSIWDTIVNFITNIILGRIVLNLIDWFGKEENQKKIQSIIRFFKDHWPVLLALYLRFGTGIGRFVGRLTGFLIKGAIKIGAITAQLALKAGLGRAGGKLSKVAGFLGGPRGKVLGKVLSVGADVAITAGTAAGIGGLASGDLKVPGFSGGGFSGGIKNFFGNMFSGLVSGPKGRDKVPAMLTDGEFVMSAGAVQKYGVDTLEEMNSAGGGTNIPKIASGVTYAAGGGRVGSPDFWSLAAISAKEAGSIPQGQADVAQSIYNRAQMGIHPGGRSIKNIITSPNQYEPTFKNPDAWKSIVDKNTALKAVGKDYASRLDMSAKSITNPKLQGEAKKFVGSRTDFRGESQKKHMDQKKGDITRGGGHNFFGWMTDNAYNSKLPKPAAIPNIVSSQSNTPSTTTNNAPKPKENNSSFRVPFTNIQFPNPFSSSKKDNLPKYADGGFAAQPIKPSKKDSLPKYANGGLAPSQMSSSVKPKNITPSQISSSVKPKNITPLPKPSPIMYNFDINGNKINSIPNLSQSSTKPPSFSAKHHKGNPVSASAYGIMR